MSAQGVPLVITEHGERAMRSHVAMTLLDADTTAEWLRNAYDAAPTREIDYAGEHLSRLRRNAGLGHGPKSRRHARRAHASGLMQFLPSTWSHTPFAAYGFSVWDMDANALAAAQIIRHESTTNLRAHLAQARAERDAAREALARYGLHLHACRISRELGDGCTCGLDEALRRAK